MAGPKTKGSLVTGRLARFVLPSAFVLLLPAPTPSDADDGRFSLILHGMHSTYAEGQPHRGGWGAGGRLAMHYPSP